MKLIKHTLFQELNEDIIFRYSLCKLGDPEVICKFGTEVSNLIKAQSIDIKKCVIYTTDITNEGSNKNSFLLAKEISKLLNIDLIVGEYTFTYDKVNFYDNKSAIERKNHTPKLCIENISIEKKTVLIIDDSFFTGKTLSVIIESLKMYTDNFLFFSIINLSEQTIFTEEMINSYFLEKKGVDGLIGLINKKNYILTTHMLRTINKLPTEEKNTLLSGIDVSNIEHLKESYINYIEETL